MGRDTGPKERLSRREGVNLHLKGARSFSDKNGLKRKPFVPGLHGNKRRPRLSNYGIQLREKQKVKRTYGVREKQFKNIYIESDRRSKVYNTDKGLEFLRLLELRLDSVLYLAGLAPSRAAARQAIVHGHVSLNGKKFSVPSAEIKQEDSIELNLVKLAPSEKFFPVPDWIEVKDNKAKVVRLPIRDEIDEGIRENLIIEYYSR
ncbi:MAG: 30S ribosomal protein S4, small subunit ribosomal protein S4 [candidate division WS6 bacterium GW2011_GWC1_33_20]|uniref:Small ribosomal subunit protein uS4 n=2 Tax=Candidatus Dojkabacteria TaxID=74243 RepID=A0A0G0ACV3_9BACT|nr:MAG: 30S ribosomal protein S4, small subunit ribosomal protein S4 [candidate division WS6 bacterium GW2011_GWE2_33_157]KKP44542.1 MAG: 30S ribosomal protein S4, small subunit ribosomal protein S4 [candidate division WS6 bacterium GW2011_GWC1_33_20]KKP46148.1 MAG: 30S ribosomal protein S4, small subunit ribosomal protein S4 [candidate division WS6 bacterium GW2011_GWF1_33_233]KKP54639.1 MAG: 30S ribosomal protein S4 [candidate division WS6 bacterium GW2011_GWB1_33_6]KKP55412.1 MAG: 30S riboso